jgi:hypothetical protein
MQSDPRCGARIVSHLPINRRTAHSLARILLKGKQTLSQTPGGLTIRRSKGSRKSADQIVVRKLLRLTALLAPLASAQTTQTASEPNPDRSSLPAMPS